MKTSRKQTQLTKAARFVIRSLGNGQPNVVSTIFRAVRRYRVKQHDLWGAFKPPATENSQLRQRAQSCRRYRRPKPNPS
jgi:hypothetical protein